MQTKATGAATDVGAVRADPERLLSLALTGLTDADAADLFDRWAQVAAAALGARSARVALDAGERSDGSDRASGGPHAGAPIVVCGQVLGALCVTGAAARAWSAADRRLLASLAGGLANEIELRTVVGELTRSNALIEARGRIDDLIAADQSLPRVLDAIVACVEQHDPQLYGSVLLLDREEGSLRDGAGASLPASYRGAIDGLAIGPAIGSCGAAAFSGEEVISSDLRADERWTAFLHLVEPLGLRHCWSFPIARSDGTVLGTFAVYGKRPRSPSDGDRRFLRDAAKLTGIAIERRESRNRLVYDATHDALTGLANRTVAFERLDEVLARDTGDTDAATAVLLVNLDRLELVNDSLGHAAGDHVVRHAAQQLRGCAGPDDLVARLNGSVCLIVSAGGRDHAAALAARILSVLAAPVAGLPDERDLTVTASIGIAVVADRATSARQAVRRAGSAMYVAEARGGNTYVWAEESDATASSRRLAIENGLRHALERDALTVVYQPLQRFGDGGLAGVEALVRWTDPQLGQVAPGEFIPIAEQSGLVHEIGAWVLETACADMPGLVRACGRELFLSVNVSAQQLRHPGLPDVVAGALARCDLPAERLWLEITETALLGFDTTTAATVRALHAMGAQVVLDDFGTGYSSLSVLKRHPVAAIKIDRSFVDGIPGDHDDLAIVTALAGMGRSLGLTVVAEGIETQAQHDVLRTLGCDYAQGYLIGRPAPAIGLGV